jgi:hypothetical protein
MSMNNVARHLRKNLADVVALHVGEIDVALPAQHRDSSELKAALGAVISLSEPLGFGQVLLWQSRR